MKRNLLSFPVIFHVCPVKRNLHPGDNGTVFQPRRTLGRVDEEIPDPLVDIGWAGNGVRQINAEDWDCGEQRNCVSLVRDTVEMGGASRDSAGVVAMEEGLISRLGAPRPGHRPAPATTRPGQRRPPEGPAAIPGQNA